MIDFKEVLVSRRTHDDFLLTFKVQLRLFSSPLGDQRSIIKMVPGMKLRIFAVFLTLFTFSLCTKSDNCHPRCAITGTCQADGRCLCWWGLTGPNSAYVDGGSNHNRIVADYCGQPCHFTPHFKNPLCTEMEQVLDGLSNAYRSAESGPEYLDAESFFSSDSKTKFTFNSVLSILLVLLGKWIMEQ